MQAKKIKWLEGIKKQVKSEIKGQYRTIEEFCFTHEIPKSILSQFFSGKRDMKVSTLCRIAEALGKKVKIK